MTPEQYHDGTKHHFHRFAQSLGYLDWASQPEPFRSFSGAPLFPLYPAPGTRAAEGDAPPPVSYERLFAPSPAPGALSAAAVGDVMRHALGLSAWKQFRESRWALRVNPSSGNLHPTESYVITGPMPGLAETAAVYHYAPDRHLLEQRSAFALPAMTAESLAGAWLLALTSIHWREAWKYGERAFRYCQHDLGHAIASVRLAAALFGWTATIVPEWSHAEIGMLVGIDRDEDYLDAEREEAACVLLVTAGGPGPAVDGPALRDAVGRGCWFGRANQLSHDHVQWTFIDEIARATADHGRAAPRTMAGAALVRTVSRDDCKADARQIIVQRRSAVAFDGLSRVGRSGFLDMLARAMPAATAPFDALWWTPRIHLLLFVHRVENIDPGLYLLPRDPEAGDRLKTACARGFLWQPLDDRLPIVCLARRDCRRLAHRLSCDQDIAADGFFSLGMIADFDRSLHEYGPSFYRNLFWETGVLGQVLYLEAEVAGARATGIGCFYDDPVHDVLGLTDHGFQSLYHFSVGMPVDDARLLTEPGYRWENRADAGSDSRSA